MSSPSVVMTDEHTQECLGGLVERSVTGDRLTNELDRLAGHRSYPTVLRCDNGPELAYEAMADRATGRVGLTFIPPGLPGPSGLRGRLHPPMNNSHTA